MSGRYQNKADATQKGRAAEMRNDGTNYSYPDRSTLNQIVHSGDTSGPFASTPNPYRDPSNSYDSKAEAALDRIGKKY